MLTVDGWEKKKTKGFNSTLNSDIFFLFIVIPLIKKNHQQFFKQKVDISFVFCRN